MVPPNGNKEQLAGARQLRLRHRLVAQGPVRTAGRGYELIQGRLLGQPTSRWARSVDLKDPVDNMRLFQCVHLEKLLSTTLRCESRLWRLFTHRNSILPLDRTCVNRPSTGWMYLRKRHGRGDLTLLGPVPAPRLEPRAASTRTTVGRSPTGPAPSGAAISGVAPVYYNPRGRDGTIHH
jgi:hypothetical protein